MKERAIGFQADALLAPQQALTLFFARAALQSPRAEFVPIDRALGRTLAEHVSADVSYPAVPRSAMDGYAVRSSDTPGELRVCGAVRMGRVWDGEFSPGAAVEIPTGGVVPAGADAVVPIENVIVRDGTIRIESFVPAGDCLTPEGSDMCAGEQLLEPGRRIGGAELGVLATLGFAQVPVYRRPVVALISSGDELVDVSSAPGPGQVRDSNRWAVAGALEALGATVRHLPTAPDDASALESLLLEGLGTCDAVVLTGGSSVGQRDVTPEVVQRLGSPGIIVHGLRVKPGKPTLLACVNGKAVIGLPGNPASALMILEVLGAPIVCRLGGIANRRHMVEARLAENYEKRLGWTWFVPVRLDEADPVPAAYPLQLRSSSASLLARASGFVVLDENKDRLDAGTPVRVLRFIGS